MDWRRWSGMGVLVLAFVYGGFLVGRALPHHRRAPTDASLAQGRAVAPVGLAPGDVAPNFTLSTTTGQTLSLKSLRGHPVWLNFWATWCPWCKKEIPELVRVKNQYGAAIAIYGVDEQQTRSQVVDYMSQAQMNYPVFLDTSGAVAGTYGVQYYPTSVFIGSDGHIAGIYTGALLSRSAIDPFLKAILPKSEARQLGHGRPGPSHKIPTA